MKCIINCVKCLTDKVVAWTNCIIAPLSIGFIVTKAYEVPKINDISWTYIVLPTVALVTFNVTYYSCCRLLLRPRGDAMAKDIELGTIRKK